MILLTISLWNTIQCYFFEKFDTVQCVENCVCLCDCMFVCICLCELMLMSVCVGNGMSAHFSCMCNYVFLEAKLLYNSVLSFPDSLTHSLTH